jgi:hypothetical protein
MRGWPLHVVFATILIGSLAAKERGADALTESGNALTESGNIELAILNVARSHGLAFREYTTITGTDVRALVIEAPGCSRPVLIVPLLVTFDQDPIVRSAREPGDVLRYVYIDRTWDKPDRLAVFAERMKYAVLATFGLTRYEPSWHLLLIKSSTDCKVADAVDWRLVWNRDYLRANKADNE